MRARVTIIGVTALSLSILSMGCRSEDVPQAHRGRMFDRTGALAGWTGGSGLSGDILQPGTYFTGIYDEVRTVECTITTEKEALTSLTKDGVQFGVDMYVRYSANCDDVAAVTKLLASVPPDQPVGNERSVSAKKQYSTFVRPALGEAVREALSPHIANDVNEKRELILATIKQRFLEMMAPHDGPALIVVHELNLSNMDYPEELDHANAARAVQAVLKDKAIAERERVFAETETAEMKKLLGQKEGAAEAAKIDEIGAALRRNPEYLAFDLQQKMPEIYRAAGDKGNLVIAAPAPQLHLPPRK